MLVLPRAFRTHCTWEGPAQIGSPVKLCDSWLLAAPIKGEVCLIAVEKVFETLIRPLDADEVISFPFHSLEDRQDDFIGNAFKDWR